MTLAARIDAILPQTQCTRCGFPSCRDYAQAIASGEANLNQCPPGGAAGIVALAELLGRSPLPLNPANGVEKPREIALIDEAVCIGCTKCIAACPVDAIVGAQKMMHTVIADECSGCELCIAPCPVDCIAMIPTPIPAKPEKYRARYAIHTHRELRRETERAAELVARKTRVDAGEAVAAALARARAKKKMAVAPAGNAEARTSGTTEKS